ncbi:hypothetical protein CDL15_Pgr001339 [Punica granatum]|uniref:Uncharacterized protein n=1 Tax=Punica granatum TaxID=22663 RepID=A0A218WK98_PUNGR|nr:hypothetical protein CDL15_Pgr001339 [Punica granatum]
MANLSLPMLLLVLFVSKLKTAIPPVARSSVEGKAMVVVMRHQSLGGLLVFASIIASWCKRLQEFSLELGSDG